MNRPDYVKCVHNGDTGYSYCGRRLSGYEWAFLDLAHAIGNAENRGYLVACPGCMAAAVKGS